MNRIEELTRRRQRLWLRPWATWTPDTEQRTTYLARLLEEAYADKRREKAEQESPAKPVRKRRGVRRLPDQKATRTADVHADQAHRPRAAASYGQEAR